MRKKKIITVYSRHRHGGYCRRMYMMIEALAARGWEVHYLAGDVLDIDENENVKPHIIWLPARRRQGWWFQFCFAVLAPFNLLFYSLTNRFSAIAIFDDSYSLLAKPASMLTLTPLILFLRTVPWRVKTKQRPSWLGRSMRFIQDTSSLMLCSRIIAVTRTMQSDLESHVPLLKKRIDTLTNSVVYPSCIDVREDGKPEETAWNDWLAKAEERKSIICNQFGLSGKSLLLVAGGEITPRKNFELIIRAIGACESDRLALIICGDGPEKNRLHALSVGLGLANRVFFAGWIDQFHEVISGSDVFVMSSNYEGMSNSMLEALGTGVPVIGSDIPEMREVLHFDELLYEATHVGKLAAFLSEIESKRNMLEKIRVLSHERARLFSFDWGQRVSDLLGALKKR